MVQDLSVKEFHIIQLAKKQIAALQEILGPLGPSPMALLVKNPPASAGDVGDGFNPWVWSLDWEDTLEKDMVTHSSILA